MKARSRSQWVNGDAKADFAVENGDSPGSVSVLLNKGDGSFQPKVDYPIGDSGLGSLAIGDLNGDGKSDLATANSANGSAGTVSVLLNKGDGSLVSGATTPPGANPSGLRQAI